MAREGSVAASDAADLYQAFVDQDPAAAIQVVEHARASGVAQEQLFDVLYAPAMGLLGGAWAAGEIDEITFTQASVVAEQIGSFVMPPAARARHRRHRRRGHACTGTTTRSRARSSRPRSKRLATA